MCDPLLGGIISGVAAIGGGLMQAQQNQALMNAQNNANAQWVAYQTHIHQQQALQEEQERTKANAAREQTLSKFTPQSQEAMQTAEQQRLLNLYGTPTTSTQKAEGITGTPGAAPPLSGETTGVVSATPFMNSLSQQVNNATQQARARIAALATANSYGGSFGGLTTVDPITLQQGANAINLENTIRQGNLRTYGVQQQVQPLQYAAGPNSGLAGTIGSALASISGKMIGSVPGSYFTSPS